MSLDYLTDKIISWSFYSLFFLTPLILLPVTYEIFEFNKIIFVYLVSSLIFASWLIKMILKDNFKIKMGPVGVPLLIFLAFQTVSTILSIHPYTSIWGYYSRFNGGLLSLFAYSLLYFAFVNNMTKKNTFKAVKFLISAGLLVAGYGILEHFGIDAKYWRQDVQARVFSTLGQPNWLAAYLTILIPIVLGLNFKSQTPSDPNKSQASNFKLQITIYYIIYTVFYTCLLFTKSRSGFLAFGVSFVVFWLIYLNSVHTAVCIKCKFKQLVIISFITLTLSLAIGTPYSPKLDFQFLIFNSQINNQINTEQQITNNSKTLKTKPPLLISESGDIRKIVWRGALKVWQNWPIFGSGPETFAYSYYNFRPRAHNDLSEWDFLYNKAHNEYLNYLATTGLAGLASYLILIVSVIWYMVSGLSTSEVKSADTSGAAGSYILNIGFFAGWVSILITNFFGFSVVFVNLLFFLGPGLLFCLKNKSAQKRQSSKYIHQPGSNWLKISGVIIFSLIIIFRLINLWKADYLFNLGSSLIDADPVSAAYYLQKSVEISPKQALFRGKLAEALAKKAVIASYHQSKLNEELFKKAWQESQKSLEINPVHLNLYKTQLKVLIHLATINPDYYFQAEQTLEKAISLAPTDAKLYYNLGIIKDVTEQNKASIDSFKKSIKLKPNYKQARQVLAETYQSQGQSELALEQLDYILTNIDPYDKNAQRLRQKISSKDNLN